MARAVWILLCASVVGIAVIRMMEQAAQAEFTVGARQIAGCLRPRCQGLSADCDRLIACLACLRYPGRFIYQYREGAAWKAKN